MRSFRAVVKALGTSAIARRIGRHPSTVQRWKHNGKPSKTGRPLIESLWEDLKAERKRSRDDRSTFAELMSLAGRAGKLPEVRTSSGKRVGPRTSGMRYTYRIGRILTAQTADDIADVMRRPSAKFPVWQALLTISQYGRGPHWGEEPGRRTKYYSVFYNLKHPEAGDFSIETEAPTPRASSREKMIELAHNGMLEMLSLGKVLVFVHGVTVFNYRLRTEKERAAWVTQRRRERRRNVRTRTSPRKGKKT